MLSVPVVVLDPELPLPSHALPGDAGADLRARVEVELTPAGGRAVVPTGIKVAIPEGYAGLVLPRSGLAVRHGVTVANSPGLIDAGYRDELCVVLLNTDPVEPFTVRRGDRIAQLVVQAVSRIDWRPVTELPPSERGTGRFGHTGVR